MEKVLGYNLFPDEKGTERQHLSISISLNRGVTTYSPMKRGLKVINDIYRQAWHRQVTTYSPMKRGLKVEVCDESAVRQVMVTTYSPMKRGLKVSSRLPQRITNTSLQPIPR